MVKDRVGEGQGVGKDSSVAEPDPWNPYHFPQGCGSGSAWIRIYFPSWIRIRIQYADPDPDPGG